MTTTNPKLTLSTEVLGVAEGKPEDLSGYILNPKEVSSAVARVFELLGVDKDDIRCVKLASDADNKPKIIVEVSYKAVKKNDDNQPTASWTEFYEGGNPEGGKNRLSNFIYKSLMGCAYYGQDHNALKWRKVVRGDAKYAQIEFDPYIFIAFAYNINFADPFFKISAPATRWTSNDKLDEMSGKERKAILRKEAEYKEENLRPCVFYVTFAKNSTWRAKDGSQVNGFHPEQVEYVYGEMTRERKKEKKKKKNH